jgi:tetraacyldisaccharide 4'-kinase
MSFKDSELYFLSVIKGEQKGFFPKLLCFFLWLMSGPYKMVVFFRNWMFDHGWLKSFIPPVSLVISVGNITAGGTGKTPVTLMLAEALQKESLLAILSRGYRSQAENFSSPLLLHKKRGLLHPASLCGDEPYLLAENLPDSLVIVGKNRYQSSKMAARLGAEVLLLDDGMQHRGIARDFEIVVMDILDPFGSGYFLPRGLLREGASGLARADLIILNNAQDQDLYDTVRRRYRMSPLRPSWGLAQRLWGSLI